MEEENDSLKKTLEMKNEFQAEIIKPVYPNAVFSSFMWNLPGQAPKSFKARFSKGTLLENTNYEYKGDGKLIHYTTLIGLKLILESGFLRMSEFGNLSDENEIIYAAKIFNKGNPRLQFDPKTLESLKENLFCLSLCQSNEATKGNHLLWEVYGDKGKGVIIELELNKENPYSSAFLLGKIQYGEKGLEPIYKLKSLAEEFLKIPNAFFPNNFQEFIIELHSLHKVKIFEAEQEIRLIIKEEKLQHQNHTFITIYKDINSKQEIKYFNKLYLKERYLFDNSIKTDNKNNILTTYPQIEIKNIILGYNISDQNKDDLKDFLNDLKKQHNYNFKISHMNLEGEIIDITYKI